jgi:hypothetical protein
MKATFNERVKLSLFVNFANADADMKISVLASNPISSLFHIFPNGKKIVLYHREILQSSLSFENYEIKNNDHLVVQFENQLKSEKIWRTPKSRFDATNEFLYHQEISRLEDFAFLKIEKNQKIYRRFIKNIFFLQNESKDNKYHACLNWKNIEIPNDKSLPILW